MNENNIVISESFMRNRSVLDLAAGAFRLYLCMMLESDDLRRVSFPRKAAKKYFIPETSFDRYIKELSSAGFVRKANTEKAGRYSPSVYELFVNTEDGERNA